MALRFFLFAWLIAMRALFATSAVVAQDWSSFSSATITRHYVDSAVCERNNRLSVVPV